MADVRAVAIVVLILLSALAVGALAGYRMHLHQEWQHGGPAFAVNVTVEFPDGTFFNATPTVRGTHANVLGALLVAAEGNLTVDVHDYGTMGLYVIAIEGVRAEAPCGWVYALGTKENWVLEAANRQPVVDGDHVIWYWGCS